jgi:hypothetical protein
MRRHGADGREDAGQPWSLTRDALRQLIRSAGGVVLLARAAERVREAEQHALVEHVTVPEIVAAEREHDQGVARAKDAQLRRVRADSRPLGAGHGGNASAAAGSVDELRVERRRH